MASNDPPVDSINPFASPESMVQTHHGKHGDFQISEKKIMGGKSIVLPLLCVTCGEAVREEDEQAARVKKKLTWVHPATMLLILLAWPLFLVVALLTQKKCTATYSICSSCYRKRRQLWYWIGLLFAVIVGMVALAIWLETPWPLIGLLLALLALIVIGVKLNGPLVVAWYSNEVFQLKGACPIFLERAQADETEDTFFAAVLAEDGRTG